jgi:hypothetical protein
VIYDNPPDKLLRAADLVGLFDPYVPGWHEIVIDAVEKTPMAPRDFMVVDIPVDSTDAVAVQAWRDRVAEVRR